MEVKGNLWIEGPGGLMLGKGRAALLQKIAATGSIAEAARLMQLSYRRAWAMVKAMNEAVEQPLVIKTVGGKKGGGAQLTPAGRELVKSFQQVQQEFSLFKTSCSQKISLLEDRHA